ncbi:tRNA (adenosine(37)-N6)-threonylcarbamoyltransferase complex ATPase subunit type 1 TsaE [Methylomarinum sp. Ch1-1]|uniref:tRNA threonylcarbamoyladenosine biosynthesis protein TsaE n=1 Tax=Methylomarinum roseum TaxID=3067653 RepID=A0AAU7NSQ8_9GAMM|nr:tRNA (adenosine(37)-N6)-threonylcarbamoyltransferase complex ATPase subunit type 1 TsaE [Methylomarinum sp. Ch1-1]MDP4520024.1 tRNA (adenosine(37)-N6)-threonylcarbamoyltransferase complex ATPase subunit type 1 TsaE [Methylomarinum sp. Ch1-1]
MKITLETTEDTEQFGAQLWRMLPERCLIFLRGDLGAGKTTLVRGVLRAAGHRGAVKSPTYTLVEEYCLNGRALFHFDLYRIKDPEELEWIGIRDYMQQGICFIEWPEMGVGFLPPADIELTLQVAGQGRVMEIKGLSERLMKNVILNWKNKDILL